MESLLFQVLSHADLDWFQYSGKVQERLPNEDLVQSKAHQVYLLLEGILTIALPHQDKSTLQELTQLHAGSFIGSIPRLETVSSAATMQAQAPCQILAIDAAQLADKLTQDPGFAARFYHLQAIGLMQQLQTLMQQFDLHPAILYQINVKEASNLFAELQDTHLDWLTAVGQRQQLPGECIVQPAYRPLEALQIVLDGALSISTPSAVSSTLLPAFLPKTDSTQEFVRIGRGDVFGEMRLIQFHSDFIPMQTMQVKTVRDAEILSIPHWRILSKLLHDLEFAVHFYRVLAVLLAGKYQTMLTKLGFITQLDNQESSNDRVLANVARAESNFEWVVQRVQTKVVVGRSIQW
ncbi:MAG: cyclic nucleotide-binding domain-containing protein [Leptolyngbyaceae cyanobacterium bins.302]|nr:cyclic nucleotide-binding domain-containing protein [Leptolyngbyaceae cyanobacterium bins.302]